MNTNILRGFILFMFLFSVETVAYSQNKKEYYINGNSGNDQNKFYNNVMSNVNVIWVLNKEEKYTFTIENSMFIGFNELVNKGGGAAGFGEKGNPAKLKLADNVVVKKEGSLQIVEDPTDRNYLQLVPGTLGANLGAGLFTK
jgi:hypothetical protein